MSKIFLTGTTGLVGSRILPRLVDAGFETRALVRKDVDLPDGATPVRGDLADPESFEEAVEGVDAVVHLAAFFRTEDEDAIWKANRDGTRSLIEVVEAKAPQARVIMSSTGNVYAMDGDRPSREDDPATATSAYGASKVAAEQLLRDSGLNWAILRLPFVYGEGDGHLASLQSLVPRFGMHPAQTFSCAHHRDIAAAVLLALTGAMDGRTVNVTDDADATVFEMAQLAGAPLEGSSEPLVNPWGGRLDGSLARELGYRPTVPTVRYAAAEGIL